LFATQNTTPDAITIQHILAQFVVQGKQAVAMEVSSHGLQLGRVNAVTFTGAVFTNLSHDHLDFHGNMESYFQAKLSLFRQKSLQFAVLNADDPSVLSVKDTLDKQVRCWTFSAKGQLIANTECVLAKDVVYSNEGIHFLAVWDKQSLPAFTPLVGTFNLENVLTVLAVLLAMNVAFSAAVALLSKLQASSGRMEKFGGQDKPNVLVDYAHTPDALKKVLTVARGAGRLWVVFGCGGNRDKSKRSTMGQIAETLADEIIITDDNPRNEVAENIIKDILSGCLSQHVRVINDRRLAISTAITEAHRQDCVVIAGKGHEDYQEINGIKWPFSDQSVVKQSLAAWKDS
jgi:UDP-N-acetylmuramoyl-L-alanyl-D-glutamate--2,6-diaminopimelate ligase